MLIGIPRETMPGETRVAVTPETAKKLLAQGHRLRVQAGAGSAASMPDEAYEAVGAEITDRAGAFGCELVLKVRAPSAEEVGLMRPGTALVGMLDPFDRPGLQRLEAAGLTAFALEAAPRTTRAQSMDVLSSQANIAGYKAVVLAAHHHQRFPQVIGIELKCLLEQAPEFFDHRITRIECEQAGSSCEPAHQDAAVLQFFELLLYRCNVGLEEPGDLPRIAMVTCE